MSDKHGWASRSGWVAGFALLALGGCAQSGVGDPCIPESIPCSIDPTTNVEVCGYKDSENYVEASSVQCRTRVCVVDGLDGDPTKLCAGPGNPTGSTDIDCVMPDVLDNHVYCSCRCGAPDRIQGNFAFCACPDGYSCETLLQEGGDGIVGDYCVKNLN